MASKSRVTIRSSDFNENLHTNCQLYMSMHVEDKGGKFQVTEKGAQFPQTFHYTQTWSDIYENKFTNN